MSGELCRMGIAEAAEGIRAGRLSSQELVRDCLARIEQFEPDVKAWIFLDPELAMAQARAADDDHRRGRHHGPLHGVPIGIKDIFDTRDMPTEYGSPLFQGRSPIEDAACVERLRGAGAVVMGKTHTAELATSMTTPPTRNPHNRDHTPGGSSSGSAAAVASFMVPGAIGSQTAGSVIRPASYCGVFGYKPSFGLIPRHRVLEVSPALDTIGVFARTLDDAALLAQCMMGFDGRDAGSLLTAVPDLAQAAREHPPRAPRFAFVRSSVWDQADEECHDAFNELREALPGDVSDVDLGPGFAEAHDLHRIIMDVEVAASLKKICEDGRDKLGEPVVEVIERGLKANAVDYVFAKRRASDLHAVLDAVFEEVDAIVTPSAKGIAPKHEDGTGSPIFASPWTLMGVPSLNMPLLNNDNGLPIGIQLVGARRQDSRLMRTARWLLDALDEDEGERP